MQLVKQRVFFTLFPKEYWILIGVGLALLPMSSEITFLGEALINLGMFLVGVKVAIIVHEVGHLIAAKVVNGVPKKMILGVNHELFRTELLGICVIVNSEFKGGRVHASFNKPSFLKMRVAFYILGGVLLNALVSASVYGLFGFGFYDSNDVLTVDLPTIIILTNALLLLNLVPYYTTVFGVKMPTDGMTLLRLPFIGREDIEKILDVDKLYDVSDLFEQKDYHGAWNILRDYHAKYPDSQTLSLNVPVILLKVGRPEEALEECNSLLKKIGDKKFKSYAGFIYNQLAWINLVLDNIDQADYFSALAFKTSPKQNSIQGTRGSVLIEKGIIAAGFNLLYRDMDFKFVNNTTLSAAIYLMLAYHLKGDLSKRDKYRTFIESNVSKLDADEKILFERNLMKINAGVTC